MNNSTYFSLPIKNVKNVKIHNVNHYEMHQQLMKHYQAMKPTPTKSISELEILKRNHQFIRECGSASSWEDRICQKYYDKLFKEYCLGDFSRYKTGAIGLRWRTKEECVQGKGHFSCGNLKCDKVLDLNSWEMNFAYLEHQEKKNALVKIRLCPDCSYKLHYKQMKEEKKMKKKRKQEAELDKDTAKKSRLGEDEGDEGPSGIDQVEKEADNEADNEANNEAEKDEEEEEKEVNIWAQTDQVGEKEKTKEEEMEDYLASMFM
jgi:protein FRA10AC1